MEPTRKRSQVWDHFEMVPARTRKQELEALVDFIVKDSQPLTVVSDPGFRALVAKLDPTCTLPSRQTVKAMVERRDVEKRRRPRQPCRMLTVHTAENIAGTARELLREWALEEKHAVCLAHALNLTVKKAMDATPGLDNIRSKTRRMITYFKSSTTAKEKLQQIQDPLVYWTTNKARYPNLYHLANQYLATPASSVPCERVFTPPAGPEKCRTGLLRSLQSRGTASV
ncbi:hypothetical protein D4764_0116820 [Takifugu flavidus]|uniref:HAT C-terminal dimerisation domain-containing protein n=1 Tax=Takifugu flavidus TaxID=433684 RepID=A0A5C6MKB9_9TELE|nr:hypothetical protein D4764_0116820 [Takifugu flavidus]